jgi:hypothetical protein
MGAQGGEDVKLLHIYDLGTRWDEWSASRPGRALPPGKGPPVSIAQEAGWAPELVWTQRLEEKSLYHSKCARKFAGNFGQNSLCPGWYLNQRLSDSKAGEPTAGNFTVRDVKACTTYTLAIYFILEKK